MGTGDGAQTLGVLRGGNLHTQRIAIRSFFQGARFLARRVSALSWLPSHCYFQSSSLLGLYSHLSNFARVVALAPYVAARCAGASTGFVPGADAISWPNCADDMRGS